MNLSSRAAFRINLTTQVIHSHKCNKEKYIYALLKIIPTGGGGRGRQQKSSKVCYINYK